MPSNRNAMKFKNKLLESKHDGWVITEVLTQIDEITIKKLKAPDSIIESLVV